MPSRKIKEINEKMPSPLQYSRILKIDPSHIRISNELRRRATLETTALMMKELPEYKQHLRLLHQSLEGLREVFESGREVLYPKTPLPAVISLNEHNTLLERVVDMHPHGTGIRQTLRLIPGTITQIELNDWLKVFCLLNGLEYEKTKFHVSFSTLTGMPGTACR